MNDELTPARWEIVKAVLSGEQGHRATKREAATLAGVTAAEITRWEKLSRENPTVEPWVTEIAPFMESVQETQAEYLKGLLWERAVHGVETPVFYKGVVKDSYKKLDTGALLRLLEVLDPDFKAAKAAKDTGITGTETDKEKVLALFEKVKGLMGMEELRQRHVTVDITPTHEPEAVLAIRPVPPIQEGDALPL